MKVWRKITLKDQDKNVNKIAQSLTNYLYNKELINSIYQKYNISLSDKKLLEQHTLNNIAGLLLLYGTKDYKRINDIVNKYNLDNKEEKITPTIEVYLDK